jgi:hypothetical protein
MYIDMVTIVIGVEVVLQPRKVLAQQQVVEMVMAIAVAPPVATVVVIDHAHDHDKLYITNVTNNSLLYIVYHMCHDI